MGRKKGNNIQNCANKICMRDIMINEGQGEKDKHEKGS